MKKARLCLLLLACVVVTASADSNPTVSITPSPIGLHVGSTQLFTAAFSDGSHIQSCTWMATGNLNAIQGIGPNTAIFAAGTLRATYVVTATCTNDAGQQAMGLGVVGVI
jgi:hypothetical protein